MRKIIAITWKDLLELRRDTTALLLMLAAPLALTLAITFAFGGSSGGLQSIPVVIVDEDDDELSHALIDVFNDEELAELLDPGLAEDEETARQLVDADEVAAAVIIPAGFTSQSFAPLPDSGEQLPLIIYENPSRSISAGVVRSVVHQFAERVNTAHLGASVAVGQMIISGYLDPESQDFLPEAIGRRSADDAANTELITLMNVLHQPAQPGEKLEMTFSWMQYYAASMAILFLMFSMSSAANSLLRERDAGTFDRLKVSPSFRREILGGKILSTFVRGLLQMTVLILATQLLLDVCWGNLMDVALHTGLTVASLAALGLLIAAIVKTSEQASIAGNATVLVLGVISGNYFPRTNFPDWLKAISDFSPSTLGIEGYQQLAAGYRYIDLPAIWLPLLATAIMLIAVALLGFRRNLQ